MKLAEKLKEEARDAAEIGGLYGRESCKGHHFSNLQIEMVRRITILSSDFPKFYLCVAIISLGFH